MISCPQRTDMLLEKGEKRPRHVGIDLEHGPYLLLQIERSAICLNAPKPQQLVRQTLIFQTSEEGWSSRLQNGVPLYDVLDRHAPLEGHSEKKNEQIGVDDLQPFHDYY